MKLREIFRYELEHRLRGASTWIYAAILFVAPFWVMAATADGGAVHVNAPQRLALGTVIVGLVGLLVSAGLFADAAVRDFEAGMDPLLFTSPLGRADYLGGRFLAALGVNAVLLLAVPLALAVITLTGFSDATGFGPFRVAAILQPYLLFLLPNLVLSGAVLFTIAVLARQAIPVYLGAIGFFIGYLVAMNFPGEGASPWLSLLGDPVGIRALGEMTRGWTPAERNTRLIGFPAGLVWNRVVWLAVAAAVLAGLHRRFRFAHPDGGRRRREKTRVVAEPERPGQVAVPRVAGSFGVRTTAWQTLSVARSALAEVVPSRAFAVVLLGTVGLALLFGGEVGDTVFDTSTWPVTILVIETVLNTPLVPITFLLIAVYAGELVWKDREVGAAEIADAAPVPEGALLLGRFLALVALLAMIRAAIMAGGILLQALQGYHRFEVGLYLRVLLGLNLADLALLAALAMTIHVVVNHKYLAHIVVLAACVFPIVAREMGIVRHNLLLYGMDPGWTYSDMNGFGPFVGPFAWFKLYWAAWALLLAVVAKLFLVRGREPGMRGRLVQARARLAGPTIRTAGVAVAMILALGGFIFYNTNVLNDYRSPEEAGRPQAEYERRYGRFADAPQPTIVAADLRVEIHPERPGVDLRGGYRLVNRTGAAIDSVHVYVDPAIRVRSLSLDRASRPVLVDDEVGYRIHALERALQPGDSLRLAFDVAFRPRGFPNSGMQTDVVRNGASFNRRWMPIIGYQPALELSGDEERRRFGLRPRPPTPGPGDAAARRIRQYLRDADLVHVRTVVGTSADQVAVTPGVLRRSWTENGRRYFHYETEAPISFSGIVFSARYAVREDRWNPSTGSGRPVALRIYHHPGHAWNLDRTIRGMKASLDYYTAHFGPYPESQLRIVEIPRYGGFGAAHPHTISFTEDYFLSRVREGEIDQPFYGTAHEVAHQWWGGQVRGAPVRGHGLLSESLANYSAMMVTEKAYGPEVARRVYDFQMQRYLAGRARLSREVPLLEVEEQPYLAYRKGAVALYTLRERIGEERVNTALRRYLEKHRAG
ncbi:MAG TPA: M1 family aminopeptidase, partial [Longimicrobium sp.]|nr:M1 family aminopeptidase [Longimicrobium sp.]